MRIWDISPGYLNRQSLLGEHRELHGIVSIIVNGKKGYSRHPETLRWVDHGWAIKQRHDLLVAEMALRGYSHRSPVMMRRNKDIWPDVFIDEPHRQLEILKNKYVGREPGRIPLPENAQQLWAQHKYSVMARDANLYRRIGTQVSTTRPGDDFRELVDTLSVQLRTAPGISGLRNALQHMWGHLSDYEVPRTGIENWTLKKLMKVVQRGVMENDEPYLRVSTALSELQAWITKYENNGKAF